MTGRALAGALVGAAVALAPGAPAGAQGAPAPERRWELAAPGGAVTAVVRAGDRVHVEVRVAGRPAVVAGPLGLDVPGRFDPDRLPAGTGGARRAVDTVLVPRLPLKRSRVPDRYRELRLALGPTLALVVRAADDGVAWRWETAVDDSLTVRDERVRFRFAPGDTAWIAHVGCRKDADCFHASHEETYRALPVAAVEPDSLAYLPALVRTAAGVVLVTESDLWDYPGLWVRRAAGEPAGEPALTGALARLPLADTLGGAEFRQRLVTQRAPHVARTAGRRTFPWRVAIVAPDEARLVESDLVWRLARPEQGDFSWVRPGKSTEEWITSRLLHGVDFVAGLNTATYRHLIDFAAEWGLEYMMFDAGWSDAEDPTTLNPDIDVPGLVAHATRRGVGIILWHSALGLEGRMDALLDRYAGWGVKGIMVDFMDRDDQPMLRFQERVAREAARRRLVVNFHGVAKPTGMERAWPNLLTREAVLGHEFDMWSERVTPDHAVTIPFIRMAAGPMDFEGGSMTNGTRKDFRVVFERPMNQGTRTQQLAQYVVYESALQYLAASVSDYRADTAFTRVLAAVPTTWDETRVLRARLGDEIAVARRHGDSWWIGALTDWTPRAYALPLDFLGGGRWEATLVADGPNADRFAADRTVRTRAVAAGDTLAVRLAPGGGFVARLRPAARAGR